MRPRRKKEIDPREVAHTYINIKDRDGFYVKEIPPKGRGVFAKTCFEKGAFLLQYNGKVLTWEEGNILEEELSSGFRFFIQWKGKKYCVDATEEPTTGPMLGRLVNHGERQEVNVKLVVIDVGSLPALCLFALRNIREDEELLYNYGTNNLPWKENLKVMQTGKELQKKKLPVRQGKSRKNEIEGTNDTQIPSACKVGMQSEQCTISVADKSLESNADKEATSLAEHVTEVTGSKAVANDKVSYVGPNCAGTVDKMTSACKVGTRTEQCTISVADKSLESNADKEAAHLAEGGTEVAGSKAVANDKVTDVGPNCAGTVDNIVCSACKVGIPTGQGIISVANKSLESNADKEATSLAEHVTEVAGSKAVANDKVPHVGPNCAVAVDKMTSACEVGTKCTVSVADKCPDSNTDKEAASITEGKTEKAGTKAASDVQVPIADSIFTLAYKLGVLNEQFSLLGVDMASKFGAVEKSAEVADTTDDDEEEDEASQADTEILEPRCLESDTESADDNHGDLSDTSESVCNTLGGGYNESFTESVAGEYMEEEGNSVPDTYDSHASENESESDSGDDSYVPETDHDADSVKSYVIPLMTSRSSLHTSDKRVTRFSQRNEARDSLRSDSPSTSKACQQFNVSTTCGDESDFDGDECITIGETHSHRNSPMDENECTSTSLTGRSKLRCNSEDDEAPSSTSNMDSETESRVYVMTTNNKGNSRTYDKPAYCYVCSMPQKKLSVHIHHHKEETLVAQWLAEEKGDKKDALWTKIRNFGNHLHNYGVLQKGEGDLIVAYRPDREADPSDYNPCVDCLGYYSSSEFYRHRCKLRKNIKGDQAKEKAGIKQSRLLLPPPKGLREGDVVHRLITTLHVDEVSVCIKGDQLILQLAKKLCFKHGHDSEQFNTLRSRLREVARLLLEYRLVTGKRDATLADTMLPSSFENLLKAVRSISGFDDTTHLYSKPSLALKLGQTMKKVAMLVISKALIEGDTTTERQARDILTLISENWEVEVSTHALRTLYQNKRNNPRLLPLTEDVALLTKYLKEQAAISTASLKKAQSAGEIQKWWKELAKVILTQMILFNRKRQGEISKLKLDDYASLKKGESHVLDVQTLSQFEQNLVKAMWRVEVVGKRGRTVPVLITDEVKCSVDELIRRREAAGITRNNDFVFAVPDGSSSHIRGCDTLRLFSSLCGAKMPALLRSTRLRKHIAVMSQVMALKDNELDVLANFLGHDIRVHREYYRLPDETLQVAKVSKLLIALESGKGGELQGKSLEELEVNQDEEIDSSDEQYDENDEDDEDDEDDGISCSEDVEEKSALAEDSQRGQKRKLKSQGRKAQKSVRNAELMITKKSMRKVPWTKEEKEAVNRHLWRFIASGKLPGKNHCEQCIQQEQCLRKRQWKNIKDFVRNKIRTEARRGQRRMR